MARATMAVMLPSPLRRGVHTSTSLGDRVAAPLSTACFGTQPPAIMRPSCTLLLLAIAAALLAQPAAAWSRQLKVGPQQISSLGQHPGCRWLGVGSHSAAERPALADLHLPHRPRRLVTSCRHQLLPSILGLLPPSQADNCTGSPGTNRPQECTNGFLGIGGNQWDNNVRRETMYGVINCRRQLRCARQRMDLLAAPAAAGPPLRCRHPPLTHVFYLLPACRRSSAMSGEAG